MSEANALPEEEFEGEETPVFPTAEEEIDDPFADIDPESMVTIRPGSGNPVYLVVEEPTPFSTLMQRGSLTFNGQIDIYVEGQPIGMDDLVHGGQTVTLIGNVKGG